MESENVQIVRRMYDLYNSLPADPVERRRSPLLRQLLALYADDIEIVQDEAFPGDGGAQGPRDAERVWADWLSAWRSWQAEIESVEERGDRVLVLAHDRFETHDGVPIENHGAAIYTVRNHEIVRITLHLSQEAARAAWDAHG